MSYHFDTRWRCKKVTGHIILIPVDNEKWPFSSAVHIILIPDPYQNDTAKMFLQPIPTTVNERIRPSTNVKPKETQRNPEKPKQTMLSKTEQGEAKATICNQMPTRNLSHSTGLCRPSAILHQPLSNHKLTHKVTNHQHAVFRIAAGFISCRRSVPNTQINTPSTHKTAQ